MKTLLILLASIAFGQPQQISISQPPPPSVPSGGGAIVGQTGQTPLYYWVIVRYGAGVAAPMGPIVVNNTVGLANLSLLNYVTLSWPGMAGATGYDVLRNTVSSYPANPTCAACAIAINTSSTSATDQNAVNLAYPGSAPGPAPSANVSMYINNRDLGYPFLNVQTNYGGNVLVSPMTLYVGSAPIGSCSNSFPRQYVLGAGTTYGCVGGAWTLISGPAGSMPIACADMPALTGGVTSTAGSCATSITNMATVNSIPYVSASGILNQMTGVFRISDTVLGMTKIQVGIIYPASDSTTAVQVTKADGTTAVMTVDTTNSYVTARAGASTGGVTIGTFNGLANYGAVFIANTPGTTSYTLKGSVAGIDNNLYINRTTGGNIFFRENDSTASQLSIVAGGNVGVGKSNTAPSSTLHVYDATASTGSTTLTVQAGAGQSTTDLQQWKNNAGTVLASMYSTGILGANVIAGGGGWGIGTTSSEIRSVSGGLYAWSSSAFNYNAGNDTGLSRCAAGVVCAGTGAQGSTAGTLKAAKAQTGTTVVGSLGTCDSAAEGTRWGVTDALAPVALATVVGGGAVHVSVYCDGTNWIVN